MPNKLTNKIVNERLKYKNIICVDNYVKKETTINWQCLICKYIWKTSFKSLYFNNTNCPNCVKVAKIDNKIIDERIKFKNFKRINNIKNSRCLVDCQCLTCNFVWSIGQTRLEETKCPNCIQKNKIIEKNKLLDELLIIKNLIRLNNFVNNKSKIKIKCGECHFINEVIFESIVKYSCVKCNKNNRINNEKIDEYILNKKIKRLSKFIHTKEKIQFECLVCQYIWWALPSSVMHRTGCPKCSRNLPLTNEIVDNRIKNFKIKRLDDIINCSKKINWQCEEIYCNNIWLSSAESILAGCGCPLHRKKNELKIKDILCKYNISFIHNFNIKKIHLNAQRRFIDFYLPYYNIFIEYDGAQHYKPINFGNSTEEEIKIIFEKQKERDNYINKFSLDNNIKIIRIDGRKYVKNKLINLLENVIIPDIISGPAKEI